MKPTHKVALILQLWQNFDRGIFQGISAYVREKRSWSVFVEEVEHQRVPEFRSWDWDGLIVNFDNAHVARAIQGEDKPVIAVGGGGGWYQVESGIPYVATDDNAIGRLAAEHLMDCGLTNFAYCGYPANRLNNWIGKRKQGFTDRLAAAGFGCEVFLGRRSNATHWSGVLQDLSAWLLKLPLPVGIMGCYDYRARHVLEACKAIGLRVPDDVAVIGVDNDIVCDLADPPLSSIEQGKYQIGYTAAQALDRLMTGNVEVPMLQTIVPVGLVTRQSTDLQCVADPGIARALTLIRDQASHGLTADAICRHVGLSRSTLDKRFKEMIGRPIDQELRRVRLARACDLLARTTLPLRVLARQSGFGSEQYLSAVFTKHLGCTPAQYRLSHRAATSRLL